jgi:hypothetical protein
MKTKIKVNQFILNQRLNNVIHSIIFKVPEVFYLLLEYGADPNTYTGWTCLRKFEVNDKRFQRALTKAGYRSREKVVTKIV